MQKNPHRLRSILEASKVPETMIQEIESKPLMYRRTFLEAIESILQNEVLNLLAFMEIREHFNEKVRN